ncbi:ABC transporter G family member 31 [Cocos nucifera]|uniref:ABC transporter G family member 31 n=1 Tax=Cocos nucifera TaxID=13894 RepID=A0A8K0MZZ9_COCNU|nr:ABC transporter G family member 31 [Cocos nucifera]
MWNSGEAVFSRSSSYRECEDDDEEALRWAALERLPTFARVRRGILRAGAGGRSEVDVARLTAGDRTDLIDRLLGDSGDAEQFFKRIRQRFDAMTLLLGPPSSGKTTLLLALAGRLGSDLQLQPPNETERVMQMLGHITYNGHNLNEFVPQRTSAYVSQHDWHASEMSVRETLEFAGHCQGVGIKYDMLMELLRREKNEGIKPDEDLDIFMKALALEGRQTNLVVEFILKCSGKMLVKLQAVFVLPQHDYYIAVGADFLQTLAVPNSYFWKVAWLDICADTLVGDEMMKGISGGQKKRLTTGELLVGPARVLFMDEISTGLDSSTTYQIIKYLRHSTHAFDGTTIISLLQPAPETYELFDDIILISEGQIVYQGPRDAAVDFFAAMGFRCPERKNVADFLQEVTSKKDQQQYWYPHDCPYQFIPVLKFADAFNSFRVGKRLHEELAVPYNCLRNHPAALSTSSYGVKRFELLKANFAWQLLLMKRNSFVYVFKFVQLLLVAGVTMTVFFRTTMHHSTVDDGIVYLGALYFGMIMILFNGFTEVSLLITKLPVLYKHRDLHFYPPWTYTLPSWLLSIPTSLAESGMWVAVTYYVVGYDPQITRFLSQFLLLFFLHQMSLALFRVMASLGRNMIVANTFGSFAMLVVMILGGFIISRDSIPDWWIWGYWISPLMYAQNAISVNEFLGHSWNKKLAKNNVSLGKAVLKGYGVFHLPIAKDNQGAIMLSKFNVALGKQQAVVSKEEHRERDQRRKGQGHIVELRSYLHPSMMTETNGKEQKGMVLPFEPLSMCFTDINYYVDVPVELKQQGILEDRLQLLVNVTGAFRPGILTALVGVSGAGKTTLMDVLAGRKTGGLIEGSITISGYPKNQETFARVSGYCEQNDVHSPCMTVMESLLYSACLRLPSHVGLKTRRVFVEEVMELVELTSVSGALVGLPGVNGLSTEQRKRLTIAVELVANPSIVFMDEPTSGLDARAAAIVMRTLLFMKRGGELIYAGPLGRNSCKLIGFFEAIPGVPKIKDGYNPAAWMLEVTNPLMENCLCVDFADYYRKSKLFQQNRILVENLSRPNSESKELSFPTKYSQSYLVQYIACLWKQNLSYWRNPRYTAVRFFYTVIISLMFGTICWGFGSRRETQQDIFNAMGSMYAAVLFVGITNATAVQPVASIERFVSFRERAAGMYSAVPFAFAQVSIEFPYVLVQSLIYGTIFYSLGSFEWTVTKFLWYIFFMYFTLLYFTFFGMMTIAITPNHIVAPIIAAPFYTLWNLFSGFMIVHKRMPGWWRWYYWADPISWTLYGLLTSQFGDIDRLMIPSDGVSSTSVRMFLRDHFGFRHEFLPIVAVMVVGFCIIFAVVFALAIKCLNFQRR